MIGPKKVYCRLGGRLLKVSYGKERPQCTDSNETCWQKNRRVHFVPGEEQKNSVTSQADESVREKASAPRN